MKGFIPPPGTYAGERIRDAAMDAIGLATVALFLALALFA